MIPDHFSKRLILLFLFVSFSMGENICTGEKELLFYDFDNSIEELLPESFTRNISTLLRAHLLDIGYCLIKLNTMTTSDIQDEKNLIMLFSIKKHTNPDTVFTIQIDLVKNIESGEVLQSKSNSFICLTFGSEEINTVETVLIRKIIENLRTQYVCHLRVHSIPQGVKLRTESGLEGVTPLEWVVSVGTLRVRGELKGYRMIDRTIDLTEPGVHTCYLHLQKSPFYQSKMMIPGSALLLASAICFISERYYYKNYHDLKKNGLDQNPGLSEKTYKNAKRFERLGVTTLVLSCASFALTFKF